MKLYYAPASSYSQRVLIALYEQDIDFTPVEVNLFDSIERDRYLQINPFGKIPTLEVAGKRLFEACCIIEYLAPKLIPPDPQQALDMRIIERTIDVYINGGREVLFADTQRSPEQRGSKPVLKAKRLLETACQTLDERLQTHLWLGGDQFSLADCTAAPTLAYLRWVYDYSHFSNLTRYVQRLEARPSVSRTFSEGQAQMLQMRSELHYPLNGQCYLQSNA